jgi:hypothetical protein
MDDQSKHYHLSEDRGGQILLLVVGWVIEAVGFQILNQGSAEQSVLFLAIPVNLFLGLARRSRRLIRGVAIVSFLLSLGLVAMLAWAWNQAYR